MNRVKPNMFDNPQGHLAEFESAQQEIVQLRRELLRWKMLARQHEARIREMETSASWRWTAILRILPEVRRRWKVLLLLGCLMVLSLPLWPLILMMMLFARGRAYLWSLIWKVRPLHDLLSFLKQRMQSGGKQSRGKASAIAPLIFRRPTHTSPTSPGNALQNIQTQLLQQLCPQQRVLLEPFSLSPQALVRDDELPELHSLSSAELSILRVVVSQHQDTNAKRGQLA